jgi:tetratricopeptide (TPR) repeat protein
LEKNIGLKRKAQLSLTEGRLEEALRNWQEILSLGDPDPYDYVTVGDLLLRLNRTEEARTNYEKASQAYESLGFLRNAIGVTKKILRMGGDKTAVHLKLAHLYMADGLFAEATEQAVAYVGNLTTGNEPPEEAVALLESLRDQGIRQPELSLRLADFYEAQGKNGDAARELLDLADILPEGSDEKAARLQERARRLAPEIAPGTEIDDGKSPSTVGMEPGSGAMDPGALFMDSNPRVMDPNARVMEPTPKATEPTEIEPLVMEFVSRDEWTDAMLHLETTLKPPGKTQGFLERLVGVHQQLGDTALIIASLERLALHFEECQNHSKASECWNDILVLNPRHVEALERTADRTAADANADHTPNVTVSEGGNTPPGTPRLDMEELLRDFQDEVSKQIPSEDGETHYALALSHYEMGLYDKALEELDIVLSVESVDSDLELRCRELQDRCREGLSRSSEPGKPSNGGSSADAA